MIGWIAIVVLDLNFKENRLAWKERNIPKFLEFPSSILNPRIGLQFLGFWNQKDLKALTFIFFLIILSLVNSADIGEWATRMRIKLPFLILPFAFFSLPRFSKRQLNLILLTFIGIMLVCSMGVLLDYFTDPQASLADLKKGKSLETPINHIRFSLLVSIAVLTGGYLLSKWKDVALAAKITLGAVTLFLFFFLHFLSVRSGIIGLYLVLVLLVFWNVFQNRKWISGAMLLGLLFITPVLAINSIPSLKMKWDYTKYDLEQFMKGEGKNHSDSERLFSLQMGTLIAKENPLLGVGIGDVPAEMERKYLEEKTTYVPKLPHNQVVYFLAGLGIPLTILFVWFFIGTWSFSKQRKNPLFLGFYLLMAFSFMMETTLETAIGTAIFIFFTLLFSLNLQQLDD